MLSLATVVVVATLASGCDYDTGTEVGPRGGVVMSDDGRVTLEIPAGALLDPVAISIEPITPAFS